MNKTQKGAWLNLVGALFFIILNTYLGIDIFVIQRLPNKSLAFGVVVFCFLFVVAGLAWSQRKQSPSEADSDERDKFIEKRAALVSFISVWILLAAETIIPRFIVGLNGSIPVWLLAIINVTILYIAIAVYATAILVQYSWGGKDGK